jgi:hypothetical protein
MSAIFIGGSRRVSRLPAQAKVRLDNVISSSFNVLVGDANGIDKAVQAYLLKLEYEKVTIFYSGSRCRNNLGSWSTHAVKASPGEKGFHFYALKDREMARKADFGFMIWDGKSAGTILNILRLIANRKKVVLLNVVERSTITLKTLADWQEFLDKCSDQIKRDLGERATPEEGRLCGVAQQGTFVHTLDATRSAKVP